MKYLKLFEEFQENIEVGKLYFLKTQKMAKVKVLDKNDTEGTATVEFGNKQTSVVNLTDLSISRGLNLYEDLNDSDAGMGRYNFLRDHLAKETEHYNNETDPARKG